MAEEKVVETGLTLHQKLLEVQKAMDYVQSSDHGKTALRYKYASVSQVLGGIRPVMDRVGLLLETTIIEAKFHPNFSETKAGASQHLTEITLELTWVNVDNPEERLSFRGYGQGIDTDEKGSGKAASYAEKTALLKFFHIPVDEEDPDAYQNKQNNGPSDLPPARPREVKKETLGTDGAAEFIAYCKERGAGEDFGTTWMAYKPQQWGVKETADIPLADKDALYQWADSQLGAPPELPDVDLAEKIFAAAQQLGVSPSDVTADMANKDEQQLGLLLANYRTRINEQDYGKGHEQGELL